jgi:membrane associated rhomboid family serine protease
MLLIPIGQENNVVRRMPWVSAALIALCLVVHGVVSLAGGDDRQALQARLTAFFEYLAARPYLTPPPELGGRLGADFAAELDKVRAEWQRAGIEIDAQQLQAEQARLDALAAEALAAWRALPLQRLGYVPAEPRAYSALTSMFVHAGLLHILGNMLFLFLTGPFIEDLYGRPLFAGLYFVSGLSALGAHAAHAPHSYAPLVGASGAIAGVMGAFLVRMTRARIQFLVLPVPVLWMLRFKLWLPAFVVLPLWFGEQFWYAHVRPDAGVAFWAHVGGFACGVCAALAIKLARVEERFVEPLIEKQTTLAQDPALERALEARLRGDFETARRAARSVLARDPDSVDAWTELYESAVAAQDPLELGRSVPRLLGLYQRLGETDLAGALVYDRRFIHLGGLPAALHLSLAAHYERLGDGRAALERYARVLAQAPQDPSALRALVRRGALLHKAGDLKGAREAYTRARAHPACTEAWPALVERALAEIARQGG